MQLSDLKNYTVLPNTPSVSKPKTESPKSVGQKILDVGTGVSNFFGGKGIADLAGATLAKSKVSPEAKPYVSFPTKKEVAGSAVQLGANFLPGAGVGAGLARKTLVGAGTGLAMDIGSKLQQDKPIGESLTPGIGTVVGGALPVTGEAIGLGTGIVKRLFKGLGSGLSGVSTETIDKIVSNPEMAQKATEKLTKSGNAKILEQNAKTLINGVSKIQNEASSAYRAGLDKLSQTDIKPNALKKGFFGALEKNKINVSDKGKIDFSNADFLDPKIQQKAEALINKINSQSDLSGTGVRKLMDIVDSAKFKSAPDGERQAFNAFIGDLKQGLKDGINASTDKLSEINAKYSADMQLSEAAQDIFGNVNFKNLPEVLKASQKLETLFSQKGLAPEVIDNYLTRIGVNPQDFKTTEAIRQISNKTGGANTKGLTIGEITQQITSAVITPKLVRDISIKTGIADKALTPFLNSLKGLSGPLQKTLIEALLQSQQ